MNITQILDACTGCGVCAAVCPSAAVKMQPDAHGFLRPVVDDAACTDCGLCTRKCPVSVLPQNSAHTDVLTGYAKDGALLPRSSSGAIFPVLAAEIIRKGGLVFGAAFDGQFQVVHTAAESVEELSALCSSKYVQGRIPSDCYAQVKAALVAGRWVYFSGMPCQVAALKSYLSRDYDTLITQDTACHSNPSPLVWEGYKAELEKQYGGKLTAFSFRNKANGWEAYHIRAAFDNGREFAQPAAESPYQRGFIKGLYSRSSCFVCKFKGIERCSDITLPEKRFTLSAAAPSGWTSGRKHWPILPPGRPDSSSWQIGYRTSSRKSAACSEKWTGAEGQPTRITMPRTARSGAVSS